MPARQRHLLRPALALGLCLFLLSVPACATPTPTPVVPQASIRISASSATVPLLTRLARAFEARDPLVAIVIQEGNSYQAVRHTLDGVVDLGASAVAVEGEGWTAPVALDAVAIIVHRDSPLQNLTLAQVRDIFGGRVWRWEDVGVAWDEEEIQIVSREEGSGTRMAFERAAMSIPGSGSCTPRLAIDPQAPAELSIDVQGCPADPVAPTAVIMVGSEAVIEYVETHRGAIGYVSQAHLSSLVKPVSVEGLGPRPADIQDGGYLLVEPFYVIAADEPSGPARAFIDFCLSEEGQAMVEKGYVPVRR
jgi:phosphate transport system substrate-binding protein